MAAGRQVKKGCYLVLTIPTSTPVPVAVRGCLKLQWATLLRWGCSIVMLTTYKTEAELLEGTTPVNCCTVVCCIYWDRSPCLHFLSLILQLTFSYFHLEPHTTCNWDSVTIFNGASPGSPIIGQYCGTTSPGTIQSGSNKLAIVFLADHSVSAGGFMASWSTDSSGVFTLAKSKCCKGSLLV